MYVGRATATWFPVVRSVLGGEERNGSCRPKTISDAGTAADMNQPAAQAPTYYWRGALWLLPEELVQPGNWGKVVFAYGIRHNLFYREYVYERIRAAEFAAMPSRMQSAFAFRDEAVARAFVNDRAPLLYRVRPPVGAHTAPLDM